MINKFIPLLVLLGIFLLAGCAKRVAQDESEDELELSVQEERTSENPL